MKGHVRRVIIAAMRDGRLRTEGGDLPGDVYPPGWLERAEALESGRATPGDWQDELEREQPEPEGRDDCGWAFPKLPRRRS